MPLFYEKPFDIKSFHLLLLSMGMLPWRTVTGEQPIPAKLVLRRQKYFCF
jgi:hypothetical protein